MADYTGPVPETELRRWVEDQITRGAGEHARGYQGAVYRYQGSGADLIIKVAAGSGLRAWLGRRFLAREWRAYQALQGFASVPRAHGLIAGRYLVLDFVPGRPLFQAELSDRAGFFRRLRVAIEDMHARGVAHGDLQKRDNLFVTETGEPRLLDFGTAIVRRRGWAPLNHYLFRFVSRMDLHIWLKHKYRGDFHALAPEDRGCYHMPWVFRFAAATKRLSRGLRRRD